MERKIGKYMIGSPRQRPQIEQVNAHSVRNFTEDLLSRKHCSYYDADQDDYQEHHEILNEYRKRHASEASNFYEGGTRGRVWDPLERDRSTKSGSGANYEPLKDAIMGKGNVQSLNRKNVPVDTISASRPSLLTTRPSSSKPHGEPAPKRRRGSSSTYAPVTRSRVFHEPPEQHTLSHNSSADVGEADSVSSQNKPATAVAHVPEYRKLHETVKKRVAPRTRRSRQRGTSRSTQGSSPANSGVVASVTLKAVVSPTSSDVLASPEISPVRVISDIGTSGRKRKLQQTYEGPIKRTRMVHKAEPIEDPDEDELNAPMLSHNGAKSRPINFAPRGAQRGAILQTVFAPTKKRPRSVRQALPITKASSGNFCFDASTEFATVGLQLEEGSSTFSVVRDSEDSNANCDALQKWLSVPCDKVLSIDHASTHSRYVKVRRSMSQGVPPSLWIEFSDLATATRFISAIPPSFSGKLKEQSSNRLQLWAERAFKECAARPVSRKSDEGFGRASATAPSNDTEEVAEQQVLRAMPRRQTRQFIERMPHHVSDELRPVSLLETEADVETNTQASSRKTRNSAELTSIPVPRWTHENPHWGEKWFKSLTYPATGRNRATVDKEDIERLDEGEFLNDNLVNFYLRFMQQDLEQNRPEILKKVHILSTFFFDRLRSSKGNINYEGVKSWTAKLDIFSYDYIVVPVNESLHWYLVLICNAQNALNGIPEDGDAEEVQRFDGSSSPRLSSVERGVSKVSLDDTNQTTGQLTIELPDGVDSSPKQRRVPKRSKEQGIDPRDPRNPRIVVLDSLSLAHRNACKCLKEYLSEEATTRKGQELKIVPTGMAAKGIPQQDNYCDCGVYILGYMEEFLKDPDAAAGRLLAKQALDWDVQAPRLRTKIRGLLLKLQQEQQIRLAAEAEERRKQRRQAKKISQQQSSTTLEASLSPGQSVPGNAGEQVAMPYKSEPIPVSQDDHDVSKYFAGEKSQEPQAVPVESPKLITNLSDSSHESAFKTAPSTPLSQPHRMVSRRLAGTHEVIESQYMPDVVKEPRLIEPLTADSASEKEVAIMTIEDDGDVGATSPEVAAKKPEHTNQRFVVASLSPERPSLQTQSAARYHGVEPKVDLTGK